MNTKLKLRTRTGKRGHLTAAVATVLLELIAYSRQELRSRLQFIVVCDVPSAVETTTHGQPLEDLATAVQIIKRVTVDESQHTSNCENTKEGDKGASSSLF